MHKATSYRRWTSTEGVVADLLLALTPVDTPLPDTGDLRRDLRAVVGRVADTAAAPSPLATLRVVAGSSDPELGAAAAGYWARALDHTAAVVRLDRLVDGIVRAVAQPRRRASSHALEPCQLRHRGGESGRARATSGVSERGFRPNGPSGDRSWAETHARGGKLPNGPGRNGGWEETHTGDAAIARLAARHHGVVTTRQLAAAGLGERAVAHRVRRGRLIRLHRGVYQVGPVAGPRTRDMAAVLATGGALSHHSAAAVWGIRAPHHGPVHITVTSEARSRPGIRVHRTTSLDAAVHDGLPLTTPARTLRDLARLIPEPELMRAAEQAQIHKLASARELAWLAPPEPRFTRSEGERRLVQLARAARLPIPRTNVRVAGWEVDAFWPDNGLVVEVDGFQFHGTRAAFERDRRKDAALTAAGYRVVRVTWRQLTEEPHAVVALLARLLAPTPA